MRVFKFYNHTFSFHLWLLVGVDSNALDKWFKRNFKDTPIESIPEDIFHACTIQLAAPKKPEIHVVVLRNFYGNPTSISTLAHELLHVTHHVLKNAGMSLSPETDEVYCYLQDSLLQRCLTLLEPKK